MMAPVGGHTAGAPAYRRFQRYAQLFDFADRSSGKTPNDLATQSALSYEIERQVGRDFGNHVTPQLMQQIGRGGAGVSVGPMGLGGQPRKHAFDEHTELFTQARPKFRWPVRPNAVTQYRCIFYNPISRKECREKNAQHGHPPEHWDSHTPNHNRPLDCDEHAWQQALLNRPDNPEYEYELQQVTGYGALHARMKQRQTRVQEMYDALQEVERRIIRMGDMHCKHDSDVREHRHRQQEISHQILRVMGKVDRLYSERLRLSWTAAEDEISSRLRLLARQIQHPAHPVNALDTLGPRVRLAATTTNERATRQVGRLGLSADEQRTIATVLQEQRKGLEFLRNTLQTDGRYIATMLQALQATNIRTSDK